MQRDAALKPSPALPGLRPAGAAAATAMLAPVEYALFAEVGRVRRCGSGETVFRRGDPGSTMYVVAEGAIDLEFGDEIAAKRLGPREFFGELGLLIGDHARSADAVAPVDGALIELRHEEFQRLVERDPALVAHFLRRAIGRVVLNEQGLVHRLRRRNQDLQMALDSLHAATHQLNQTEALVRVDELTGLHNRRGLVQHLAGRRADAPDGLALILVDCDRFKLVNDQHGHVVGDRVLQDVAGVLRSVLAEGDIACRLGGDEFCLLIRTASRPAVLAVADFILAATRRLLRTPPPTDPGQPSHPICTVSLGACLVDARYEWNDWYAQADLALYRAKRLGGNRVEWQDEAGVPA